MANPSFDTFARELQALVDREGEFVQRDGDQKKPPYNAVQTEKGNKALRDQSPAEREADRPT